MSLECFCRSPDSRCKASRKTRDKLARERKDRDRSRGLRRPASVSAEIGDETRIISRASVFTSLNAELKIRGDPEWESEARRTHGDRDRERRGGEEEPHPLSSSSHGCSATRKHRADISERSRDVNDLGARVCVRARRANTHDACLRAKRTRRVSGAGDRAHRALFVTTTSRKNRGRAPSVAALFTLRDSCEAAKIAARHFPRSRGDDDATGWSGSAINRR